jgi:hypothetical protein
LLKKDRYRLLNVLFTKAKPVSQNITCAQSNKESSDKENAFTTRKPKNDRQTIRNTLFSQCTVPSDKPINQKYIKLILVNNIFNFIS